MPLYTLNNEGTHCIVKLSGDLTAIGVPDLQESLKAAIDGGARDVVFDFSGTVMLDSSGIGLLIAASNTLAPKNGKVSLVNISEEIMHLLKSMRLVERLNAKSR